MIKAIIIDDESHCIETLRWMLQEYCAGDIQLIGASEDPHQGYEIITRLQPDLVFLDIEMPALSGIDLLKQLKEINFHVIFTTAYDQYAIKAIKLNALDYLLKPIDKDELKAAIEKIKNKPSLAYKQQIEQLQEVHKTKVLNKIALSTMQGLIFVTLDDVIRIEAESSYCNFILKDKKKILLSKTLADVEEIIQSPEFFRAHKSYIINLKYVEKYIRGDGGEIVMSDGVSIALSRSKKAEFLELFSKI